MARAEKSPPPARERIVETASRLFYAEGVRAVGVDRIIAEAGVAKMTLYNHFASKDDLVLAVLEHREGQVNAMFAAGIERHVAAGMDRLSAFFAAMREWFESPGFRGCAFINTTAELANGAHPAVRFAAAHKRRFHEMLAAIVSETAGERAGGLAPAIALLVEGAIVAAMMETGGGAAAVARDAAWDLIAAHRSA